MGGIMYCSDTKKNVPAVNQATARRPVELKLARAVGHGVAIQTKGLGGSLRSGKLDKAVSGVTIAIVVSRRTSFISWRWSNTYPEFLSRITLTLTVSPAAERKTPLIKFSSIQGSSSPILRHVQLAEVPMMRSARHCLPKGGLGLVACGRRDRGHVGGRGGSVCESHLAIGGASVGGSSAEGRVEFHCL